MVLPEPPLPRKVTSFGGGAPPELATTIRRLRLLRWVTAWVCLAETTNDGAIRRPAARLGGLVGISEVPALVLTSSAAAVYKD